MVPEGVNPETALETGFEPNETQKSILAAVTRHGKAAPRQIAHLVPASQATVQRQLRKLMDAGLVTKTGSTKGVYYSTTKPNRKR